MNKRYLIPLGLCVFLASCAAPVSRDLPPVTDSPPSQPGTLPPVIDPVPAPDTAEPTPPPVLQPINPAVTSLINQSRAQYNSRDYAAAVATAERGLRIDRRAPELYLVIAQSYLQQGQTTQAEQFAQQGLRHAQPGSPVSSALQRVRDILSGGDF